MTLNVNETYEISPTGDGHLDDQSALTALAAVSPWEQMAQQASSSGPIREVKIGQPLPPGLLSDEEGGIVQALRGMLSRITNRR